MALVSEEPKCFKAQYRVKAIIQNLILKAFTTGNIRNFLFLKLEDSARYGGFLIAPAKGFIRGFLVFGTPAKKASQVFKMFVL